MKRSRFLVYDDSTHWMYKELKGYCTKASHIEFGMDIPVIVKKAPCLIVDDTSFIFGEDGIMSFIEKDK